MLWIELSSVVVETWDGPGPLGPPRPGSEAIEYMDMRFAMVSSGDLRRPERDTAESGFDQAATAGRPPVLSETVMSTTRSPPCAARWAPSNAVLHLQNEWVQIGG